MTLQRPLVGALAVLLAFGAAACGDDDDDVADDPVVEDDGSTDDGDGDDAAAPEPVTVTMTDYAYTDLPESVPAGTTFSVVNESAEELHELVAVRLPDGEDRPADEIAALPEEELMPLLLGGGDPAAVLLAMPGSDETIPAVGDGTLADPGRYFVFCFIPQGADPQEYVDAAATSEGPPEVDGGPPHFVLGMYGDLVVE